MKGGRGAENVFRRREGRDYGSNIVDIRLAGTGQEKKASGQEIHGSVGEKSSCCVVEEPRFLFAEFGFGKLFLEKERLGESKICVWIVIVIDVSG